MGGFKKIGITGADGFLGENLAKELSKSYNLILFGLEKKYDLKNSSWRVKDLFDSSKEDFRGIDSLIHLAGTPYPKEAIKKNYELTKHVLDKSIDGGVKDFIFMSSYAIYGPRKSPAKVTDPKNSFEEYSKSKDLAEEYILEKSKEKNFNYKIIRSCSVYGEGGRGLINIIKKRTKEGLSTKFDALFERNYLHVEEFSNYVRKILEEETRNKVYNVTGERLSTKNLYEILISHNVDSDLVEEEKPSFLCEGENNFAKKVEGYLFPSKNHQSN